jgi:hypothetical protein
VVEFLPTGDEPEPDGPPPAPPHRRSWLPRAVVAAGALAAIIAWIATRPSNGGNDDPAGGQPLETVTRSFTPAPPPSVRAPGPPLGEVSCLVGAPVETEIVLALHKFFHQARVDTLHANRCVRQESEGPRIVYEAVGATIGRFDMVIALTARGPAGTGLPAVTGLGPEQQHATLRASLAVETAAVHVSVEVFGTGAGRPPLQRVHRLADYVSFSIVL